MRYLTNKRPGTCVDCGMTVHPGGRMWKSRAGWNVSHGGRCPTVEVGEDHGPDEPDEGNEPRYRAPRGGGIFVRLNSGAELYQNARGRCEDAGPCGCCNF